MRFLLLTLDGWPTFRPDVTSLWGHYLHAQGVASDMVCSATTTGPVREPWPPGKVWLSPSGGGKVRSLLTSFLHDCQMLWRLRHEEYTGIVVRDKSFIALPALIWARWRGLPFFYWMSFPMAESLVRLQQRLEGRQWARWLYLGWRGHVGGWLLRTLVLPKADHVFVQSDRMKQDLQAVGLKPEKMTPVPMCVDPVRFAHSLPQVRHPQGRRVIAYLGECSRVRRIDFLFHVVAEVRRQVPEVLLLIVGDALEEADRRWLADTIAAMDLTEHVQITGWLPADQVASVFGQAEIALALMAPDPLLDSATPTKLVEYLAMGRAVVANEHPDQQAVLQASGGGLCVPFEPKAFAKAVQALLADEGLRRRMADAGRTWTLARRNYQSCAVHLAAKLRSETAA